ncbi:glycosyltransferase [Rickettsiella endosymbiont of Miltochrista miniata]|uniref:glycosyltransferase n=1 Tax=Rickettsiella endosymbiont of Miltochrista miniata TaxID=3066239 RepID=UPI00313D11D2
MENILHLGKFSNEQVGGIETVVDMLLTGLSLDFNLFNLVANNSFRNEIIEQSGYIECSIALAGMFARTPFCPSMPYHIKKLYQHYQFSIVHLHLPNPMAHLASEILPDSVKRIISWHSDVIRQKKLLRLYQPFVNRLLKQASALIVSTPYLAEHSKQIKAARERNIIHTIPYGVDFDYFLINKCQEKIDQIKHQYSQRFLVFALGRHVYYKGFCYLIEAMQQLPKNIILLLGGEGALTQKLKQQVKILQLEQRVFFLGQIAKQDLPAYYHACDLFCLPSINESEAFGIAQLEAMACAKPVICCDVTQAASNLNLDAVTGFVVPPRCSIALANAIYKLYQEPLLLQSLGRSAYHYAKENFTTQKMVAQIKNLYQEIHHFN